MNFNDVHLRLRSTQTNPQCKEFFSAAPPAYDNIIIGKIALVVKVAQKHNIHDKHGNIKIPKFHQ